MIYTICMTVVVSYRSLKFKVNAKDHSPPHVHVEGRGAKIRINLLTFEPMDKETDFEEAAVRMIIKEVKKNSFDLLKKWKEYHGED
jgi:hypothetical protein